MQAAGLTGVERALVLADPAALAAHLAASAEAATSPIDGLPPLLALLRRDRHPADVRRCTELLLDAGADPDSSTPQDGGEWGISGLSDAVERRDLALVRLLLDAGLAVDTRGWSNFTPLDQAAMHGRTEAVRLLIERGADLDDCAFDDEGPTPLDCALWGLANNRADDGDYRGTVAALLAAGAPTRHSPPTGDEAIDAMLERGDR
ncbi:MAG TPA: ankyrin repeat domain-containing protein [Pseudonocardia sp.]|nr:ankyrin repeat domain-containing protein [Pseudonocardia sp.]